MPDKPELTDIDPLAPHVEDVIDRAGDFFGGLFEKMSTSTTVGTGEEDRTSDSDGDGVTDWDERHVHGTDPRRGDTDGDGLGDGWELREYGTDPTDGDSDSDGLADGEELRQGTDPFSWDTDGDGWSDGMEVRFTETDPLSRDSDGDGLSDRDEGMVHRTDPNAADSDGDGTSDGAEVAFEDGTWMGDKASELDADATTLEAMGGVVVENDGVVEYGTDPSDLDAVGLAVGGHDPLPVAGTLDDAQSSLAEPAPTMQTFGGSYIEESLAPSDTNPPNINDPNTWPTLADAVTTTVDEAPTEVIRPSPIQDAVTSTPDDGLTTVASPPNPIDEAVSSWEADTTTELLPPNPIDEVDLDSLDGLGDPLFADAPGSEVDVGDAVTDFEPGGLDTDLDFGG